MVGCTDFFFHLLEAPLNSRDLTVQHSNKTIMFINVKPLLMLNWVVCGSCEKSKQVSLDCPELCVGSFVLIFGGNCIYGLYRLKMLHFLCYPEFCWSDFVETRTYRHISAGDGSFTYLIENIGLFHY